MQTEIALSRAEAEYVALSQALRSMIPIISLLNEFQQVFENIELPKPKVCVKMYENNMVCISIAESEKFTPRTKHITLKCHWFKQYAREGLFKIEHISTLNQLADMLTKPLDEVSFKRLRKDICGY